ncbi:MAG: folate-binding protein [Pseudomonadota bacterium]
MADMSGQPLSRRAVVELIGADTIELLERLVTNTTTDWKPGAARFGALLTPQGKILAEFIAHRTDEGVLLDVADIVAEDLAKRLKLFRLRAAVEIAVRDDLGVVLDEAGAPDPRSATLPNRTARERSDGGDAGAFEAARIAAGVPEQGADFGPGEVFPADVNMDLLGGVDFQKGCFVGQEVVSRMKRRGTARRRTLTVRGDNLSVGAAVSAGGAPIGEITSAAGAAALARLRIDRLAKALDAGDALLSDETPVMIEQPDWLAAEMQAFQSDGSSADA